MTTTPKKLQSRTRSRKPRGNLQPTRNDPNVGILSYTFICQFTNLVFLKTVISLKEHVHGLPFPVPKSPQISGRCQTQPELDPSDGWDDPVDEIHSYVTRGTFCYFKPVRYLAHVHLRILAAIRKGDRGEFRLQASEEKGRH